MPPILSTVSTCRATARTAAFSIVFHHAATLALESRHLSTTSCISSSVMPILSAPKAFSALTPPP